MITTQHTHEKRKKEIRLFLENVNTVEGKNEFPMDFYNILHSNALLMLYNLVESTVLGGILEIYDKMENRGLTYNDVSEKIQRIWFDYKFNQVYQKNASHDSYKEKAYKIIDDILNKEVLKLDRKAVDISGNLDADRIRNICYDHGINFIAPKESQGGYKIANVRDLRNGLAHGRISFVECGRDYTLADLTTMTEEIILFLDGLLNCMMEYYRNDQYTNHP
jgi:hypothetical protein